MQRRQLGQRSTTAARWSRDVSCKKGSPAVVTCALRRQPWAHDVGERSVPLRTDRRGREQLYRKLFQCSFYGLLHAPRFESLLFSGQ